ncbi:uncharacterized protein LOC120433673 [Oreochromis aureus]|uniref:uncharacterized protein LOC120433673 n=1 Tax=Oreochromis aureus TaxID=47969 RepID=UPI0019545B0C|nr:uncharacterized protein LOC120433673 [Oreochromis aureus]
MYPKSLQDVIEGDVVGQGYHSLVKQIQARIENVKRSTLPVLQKRKQGGSDDTDEVTPEKDFPHQSGKEGKRLLDFLKTTCADKSKRVLEAVIKLRMQRGQLKGCSEDVKDMMLLLLSYFDEKEETLFHYVDETCLAKEVQVESLPVTPCIIVCGSSCFASRLFMLSIDHKVVNDQITDFISAICLMLGSYYCLNIHYPWNLAPHLNFFRVIPADIEYCALT